MTYDYEPMYAGAYYDPAPAGGQVTSLSLYDGPDRTTLVAATTEPAIRLRPGVYRFELPDVPPGRYWASVAFIPSEGAAPVRDQAVRLDLPLGLGTVTSPEAVAEHIGIPLPLTAEQRDALLTAIRNAQADVVGYLGQPIVPTLVTHTGLTPRWQREEDLDDVETWPVEMDDQAEVSSYRPRGDGTYDVDFRVGFDGAANTAVVRYVTAHAAESERQRPGSAAGGEGRRVSSVSAEGQAISYEPAPAAGQAGALPALTSLARWRRLLYQPVQNPARAPWPYSPGRGRGR
ncbi:hypothetical protein HHL19_35385 [Streptomyces sp. R302]|uniref:hypothetical protein n=1 Tax=unclassified Streptomyces TaxID=2593676 RepID=UPI00145D8DFB|nr:MULTISPECIES: hypothetical protein [unclassified Streptomyces]NML55175.1 hypothetical protein [Streptomyces sp. R301]NML83795.1 hypothetical protein [Streptomyces sp. R302]